MLVKASFEIILIRVLWLKRTKMLLVVTVQDMILLKKNWFLI